MADETRARNPLRDTDPTAIRLAKTLLRSARYGALAALDPQSGWPLASRVAVASDADGAPLILVSSLSAHTAALAADPRCSLLLGEPGKGDPLAHPRITLFCRSTALERGSPVHERAARRYLARHPKAKLYADFADFAFVRLTPEKANLNGGFGKAYHLRSDEFIVEGAIVDELASREADCLKCLNTNYETLAARAKDAGWTATGIDVDGIDLRRGDEAVRLFYPKPLGDTADLRARLADLADRSAVGLSAALRDCFAFREGAEERDQLPEGGEPDQDVDDLRDRGGLTAEDGRHQIEVEGADEQPVQAADNDEKQGDDVERTHSEFLPDMDNKQS